MWQVTGGGDSSIRQWHLQGNSDLPLTQVQLAIPRFVKAGLKCTVHVLWEVSAKAVCVGS